MPANDAFTWFAVIGLPSPWPMNAATPFLQIPVGNKGTIMEWKGYPDGHIEEVGTR